MKNIQLIFWLVLLISPGQILMAQLPFGQTDNCDDFEASSFQHTVDRSAPDNWDWRDATSANLDGLHAFPGSKAPTFTFPTLFSYLGKECRTPTVRGL